MRYVLALTASLVVFAGAARAASPVNLYRTPTPLSFPVAVAADRSGDVWFLESDANKLGIFHASTATFSEYAIPTVKSVPVDMGIDSKGAVWFIEQDANQVARFDPVKGSFEEYEIPTPKSQPFNLAIDEKGRVWFTEFAANKIGVFDPAAKKSKEFPIPSKLSQPAGIIVKSGLVWFIESGANMLGCLDPATGRIKEYPIPIPFAVPSELAADKNGGLWFGARKDKKIVSFNTWKKEFREYGLPGKSLPEGIAADSEGFIWYCDKWKGKIGRLDPRDGGVVEVDLPPSLKPFAISAGAGKVWFTEISAHKLGVIETAAFSKKSGLSVELDRYERESLKDVKK